MQNRRDAAPRARLLALALCGTVSAALGADDSTARKEIAAPRLTERPVIDGRLDEPLWQQAAVIDDFTQIRPHDGEPPTERTEVLVAYDADNLYIAARFWGSGEGGGITANILRQGSRLAEDDRLAVILDPFDSARTGYRFEVNLNSVRNDMLYQSINAFSGDWTVIWDARATRTDYGWSLEIAIPFKTLPFDAKSGAWGFNVSRAIRRKGEEVLWVSRNRTWNPAILGRLTGIHDVDQGVGLDVVPSVGLRHLRTYGTSQHGTTLEPSLDAYYRVTPSLNASLTINTDFSATELDDRQVNLTRFGLFFPEKRDFFVNDSDVFEFGRIGTAGYFGLNRSTTRPSQESGRPFFSRRIGLSPAGTPIDLTAGAKLSGRVGRWRLGALAVQQDEYDAPVGPDIRRRTLGVARGSLDVLQESSIGFIATSGDPGSNESNSLYGMDFLFLNSRFAGGRSLEGEAWFQDSQTPDAGPGSSRAWGAGLRMPSAEGLRFGLSTKELGSQFRPALGFVSRRGVRESAVELGYIHNVHRDWLQLWTTNVDATRVTSLAGGLQTQVVSLRPLELETVGRDILRFIYAFNQEHLARPFTIWQDAHRRVVLPVGDYRFEDWGFDVETGTQRRVALRAGFRRGEFYDGHRTSVGGDLTWRPSRHLALKGGYDINDITLPYGNFSSRILRATTEVNFSSMLSWITLMQYDNVSELAGFQSRLQFVPRAGQKYFLVANHGFEDFDGDGHFRSTTTEISLRAGYTWRF